MRKTEGKGFEPLNTFVLPVFKTGAIGRSATPPGCLDYRGESLNLQGLAPLPAFRDTSTGASRNRLFPTRKRQVFRQVCRGRYWPSWSRGPRSVTRSQVRQGCLRLVGACILLADAVDVDDNKMDEARVAELGRSAVVCSMVGKEDGHHE